VRSGGFVKNAAAAAAGPEEPPAMKIAFCFSSFMLVLRFLWVHFGYRLERVFLYHSSRATRWGFGTRDCHHGTTGPDTQRVGYAVSR
jgi:hypothetical protein